MRELTQKQRELVDEYWPGSRGSPSRSYAISIPCEADPDRLIQMVVDADFNVVTTLTFCGKDLVLDCVDIWLAIPAIAANGGAMQSHHTQMVADFWQRCKDCSREH